jgi:hypothetical protein
VEAVSHFAYFYMPAYVPEKRHITFLTPVRCRE